MDFFAAHERFYKNWLTVENFRRRIFLYKHLLSLPYQWIKTYHAKRVKKLIDEETLYVKGNPNVVMLNHKRLQTHCGLNMTTTEIPIPIWLSDFETVTTISSGGFWIT